MTAKEIAAALRAAKTLDHGTLAPLYEYRAAKARTGAPTDIETALLVAANECQRALDRLTACCEEERGAFARAADALNGGGMAMNFASYLLTRQNNFEAIVYHEVFRARREAFLTILDAFEALADRIVATPEERAQKDAERAQQEAAKRAAAIAAWCKLSAGALAATAQARGLPCDGKKAEIAARLVDAGATP